ncbi:hypothetical protein BaRGS_00026511, partial [Batillaria attramentaria]
MADDDIDIEGEFDFKLEVGDGLYDTNELPSKSANLLPEFTNPPWMLEQGWSLDNCMDEKSKATIEKMLLEEHQYLNGRKKGKYLGINKSVLLVTTPSQPQPQTSQEPQAKRQWTDEEKKLFLKGLGIYGRSWSKIAQLIPSRTAMQVKNYAQQYMKNVKRAQQQRSEEALASALSMDFKLSATSTTTTASSTVTASSIAATVASVTTAQPTITTLPHSELSSTARKHVKKKTVKRKPSQSMDSVAIDVSTKLFASSESQPLKTEVGDGYPALAVKGYAPNGFGLVSSSRLPRMKQEPKIKTAFKPFSSPAFADVSKKMVKLDKGSDSESEDVDIDIENDDGDDNLILQSRSASPSSVYSKLLQQANVEKISENVREEEVERGGKYDEQLAVEAESSSPHGEEQRSSQDEEDSDDCLTQNSDTVMSSGSSSKAEVGLTSGVGLEAEDGEEDGIDRREIKHIVNGVIAASGEVFEFPIPIEENTLSADTVLEEEKMVHAEFFDGRPLKTPERYLKIRNYILDCWKKSKPAYLNKTSVRPGLKNCGDVNCIGRIHAYLESVGAINFGC